MESFSEKANLARVKSGLKGGPMFQNPILPPKMTFVEGTAPEVVQKLQHQAIVQGTPIDTWSSRRNAK